MQALIGNSKGWVDHPATKMWRGHEAALCGYGIAMCMEWRDRGCKDTLGERFIALCCELIDQGNTPEMSNWVGDEASHAAHRSNLMRKDPEWYSQYLWTEPDNLPYIWPVPLDTADRHAPPLSRM